VDGAAFSSANQGWDVAGRRTLLSLGMQGATMNYGYGWRADGLLGSVSTSAGSASYAYSDGGLLDNRSVGNRATTVTARDGAGRPLTVSTTVNAQQNLAETLTWTGDGLLNTHTLARTDFTDQRSYSYAPLSRRLTTEQMNLDATHCWTNDFAYDSGASGGLGLLTSAGTPGSAGWSGGISPLGHINTETNTVSRQSAYGRLNGQATVSAFLDGHSLPVSINTTPDYAWTNRWSTTMELTAGAHQLTVSALHPSGLFTTNASVWFTNNLARQADHVYRDGAGNITQRIWSNPDGSICRDEALWWDQKQRLTQLIVNAEGGDDGFVWFGYYDGLDRLLYTLWGDYRLVILAQTNQFVYDPQVPFLDMGVNIGPSGQDGMPGQMTWKLCGPDLNGRYGGMNGAGGLEAVATGVGYFAPTINDARGNVLGTCDPEHGSVTWTAARPTGYGAVPGYRPLPLGHGGSYAQSAAWRGKWADVTGYIYIGKRFYDPVAGMWLSPDPVWNSQDPSYWSYCGGDPINHFDPDGRCVGAANAQLASFEDSFIRGTVGLAQWGLNSAGDFLGMPELNQDADSLEATRTFMQRNGLYTPGSANAQIGQNLATVTGAYGMASQIPTITGGIGNWWNSLWSEPNPPVSTPTWQDFLPDAQARVSDTQAQYGNVEAYNMSKRLDYMGRTPGKGSATGRQVLQRMFDQGTAKVDTSGNVTILNSDGQWVPINTTDMSHTTDAVTAWNEGLYETGPKSQAVRDFMLDPNNYELDSSSINRSQGAQLNETYVDPDSGE